MSVPVAGEWLWKRVIFVSPLPLANVWFKSSKAVGDRAFAQGPNPAAFSCAFDRYRSAYLAQYFVRTILELRIGQKAFILLVCGDNREAKTYSSSKRLDDKTKTICQISPSPSL